MHSVLALGLLNNSLEVCNKHWRAVVTRPSQNIANRFANFIIATNDKQKHRVPMYLNSPETNRPTGVSGVWVHHHRKRSK